MTSIKYLTIGSMLDIVHYLLEACRDLGFEFPVSCLLEAAQ